MIGLVVLLLCPNISEGFSLVDTNGHIVGSGILGLLIFDGGTVCGHYFTDYSADAICRKMGYNGQMFWTSGRKWDIQSTYDITMDDVICSSGEWSSCSYSLSHNCGNYEDVFLQCDEIDFSLVDTNGHIVGAGILGLLIINGGTVCDGSFTDYSADAICRKMGYNGQMSWTSGSKWDIQSNYDTTLDEVSCYSDGWSSCSYSLSHNCGNYEGHVFLQCDEIDFSLVDTNGHIVGAGILGLLIGKGGTVCDGYFTDYSADAICRKMGYNGQMSWTSGSKWDIQSNYDTTLDEVSCSSGEWSSCSYSLSHDCDRSEDVFLQCNRIGEETDNRTDISWKEAWQHSRLIPADLEKFDLHLKTSSFERSNDKIVVMFHNKEERLVGGISIMFYDAVVYDLLLCDDTNNVRHFPSYLSRDIDKHWVIQKDGYRIRIRCNGVQVLDTTVSSGTCHGKWSDRSKYWGQNVSSIKFMRTDRDWQDTATNYYYIDSERDETESKSKKMPATTIVIIILVILFVIVVGVYVYHVKRKNKTVRNNMREEPVFPAPPDNVREEPVFPAPPDIMREEPVFPDQTLSDVAPPKYEESVRAFGEETVPSYEDVMGYSGGYGDGGDGHGGGGD
ncbi:deleted in malignant brain tumors 1 protein-like [Bolinopsis microptera]|uniref:deleted in malignant brain tumors 1 protein-like n=1 Tax=Bolinopsis microptera TaxID=2820187 RepID=UPI003079CE4B